MLIKQYAGKMPEIDKSAFIAENATIIGDVIIGQKVSVWYGAVIRADGEFIHIGNRTNIQDNCVLHIDHNEPIKIGEDVTIGHGAILHSCSIGDRCIIGMGSTILNGAQIGDDCIIGAGALVTKNTIIPSGSMVVGFPAKVRRELTQEEKQKILDSSKDYIDCQDNM